MRPEVGVIFLILISGLVHDSFIKLMCEFVFPTRVQLVHRKAPKSIFGTTIGHLEHASDLTRIQV